MIYERNVLANWRLSANDMTANSLLFLTNDGSYSVATYEDTGINANNLDLNSLIGASANYFNRFILPQSNPLISMAYCFNNHDILFMNTNRADFFVYWSANAFVEGQKDRGYTADDLTSIDNYYRDTGYTTLTDFQDEYLSYGNYSLNLSSSYCVFDYTNLYYASEGDKYYTPRGENLTFYTSVIEVSSTTNLNNLEISYGAPYYSMSQDEYTRGYGNGYASGYANGKRDGYEQGYNAGGGNISGETATAFDYIGGAFNVVSSILEIQVLPHITLGLCFSIPLVLTLIMVIFKMVKK